MPIDKVLQQMFLNYINILIEKHLKPEVFAYRQKRYFKLIVASIYAKLNRAKYINQICIFSVNIKKCFDKFFHNQILEQYFFPKSYNFLLFR